ncbi:sporulation integral membrane protein YtvI [Paenibacillus sp. HJL G12]|uniref:Sporulation integral membrane protein YtvI n=1 Tax=Paenibacillus dendrobii TaxID=2691084 RepID=A0A7X3IL41_9BACL|nr:sporulation integral membrane protein YtvI [Paenibacillus dendrobii]MWV45446.1 sporulation integral membrane protein YtvI [Paenibacillus dendrobii]
MLPLYKKYWRTFIDIGMIVLTVLLIMYVFSKLYQIAAPVFLSFLVFFMIEPLAKFLNRRGLPKTLAAAISVLLFVLVILGILFGIGLIVVSQIAQVQDNLPQYTQMIQTAFTKTTAFLQHKIEALPPNITEKMNENFKNFTDYATGWATSFLKYMVSMFSSFSSFMANFGIAIILAFFLSTEIGGWRKIVKDKSPKTLKNAYAFLKTYVLKAIGSYIKAQFIMVLITMVLIYIGLLILRTGNELSLALVCAIFDILPLVGVPVILIPWIVYLFIVGNISLAIGLCILLVVVLLTRQLLEPRITGNSIGISSAFLMLSFMIISLSIFGVAGLILSPVLLILLKELLQQGYLQRWIRLPQEEFDVSPFDMSNGTAAPEATTSEKPADS